MQNATTSQLREIVRRELPRAAFKPRALRALAVLPYLIGMVVFNYLLLTRELAWYFDLALSVGLGFVYASAWHFGHDLIHGAVIRNRGLQNLLAYPCFVVFGLSPTLWRFWHNQVHHADTNVPYQDPDSYNMDDEWRESKVQWAYFITTPGARNWTTYLYYTYFYTVQCQSICWAQQWTRVDKLLYTKRPWLRRLEIAETLAMFAFWIGLAIAGGSLLNVLWLVILPMAVANLNVMSYISTQHFLRPLTEKNDPLENTMGVTVPRAIDHLHFFVSHHIEHHLFPSVPWTYRGQMRRILEKHAPDRYLAPSFWQAVKWVYKTPRRYRDAWTLVNPYSGETADLRKVEAELRAGMHRSREKKLKKLAQTIKEELPEIVLVNAEQNAPANAKRSEA